VHFRYPTAADVSLASLEDVVTLDRTVSEPVLRGVSFTVEPGQMVALVGPSGAGKSTTSMLVSRVYDVSDGEVRVGGVDVRDATLESLRDEIGVVTQDSHLFHETIAENLRYAKPDATDEELWAALSGGQVADLVRSLPDGLDTMVGERGYRFSGGEKQRIAIARLLLKAPSIVILDEATVDRIDRSYRARDRTPPLHRPRRRPDPGTRSRPDCGTGPPRPVGRRRRPLRRAVPHAVRGGRLPGPVRRRGRAGAGGHRTAAPLRPRRGAATRHHRELTGLEIVPPGPSGVRLPRQGN
jgi:ABC-type branched-subunit amino acid transport system ATPase component